jgi:hypothetical protein
MKLRPGDIDNLKHPMTWVVLAGLLIYLVAMGVTLFDAMRG